MNHINKCHSQYHSNNPKLYHYTCTCMPWRFFKAQYFLVFAIFGWCFPVLKSYKRETTVVLLKGDYCGLIKVGLPAPLQYTVIAYLVNFNSIYCNVYFYSNESNSAGSINKELINVIRI